MTDPGSDVLRVQDLTVTATRDGRHQDVVRGVTFAVQPGEVLGIVGESGSGKTMLTKAATGLLPHTARVTAGRIELLGQDLTAAGPAEWAAVHARDIGVVFQNAATALNPRMTVFAQVREALSPNERGSRRTDAEHVAQLLASVEIDNPLRRLKQYPHELSGGIAQRVVIAMALARGPRLLLADEATTALDAVVQRQILDLIGSLRNQHRLAVLLISHDLDVVRDRSDRIAVMHRGVVVETGPSRHVVEHAEHPYTRELLASSQSVLLASLGERSVELPPADLQSEPIIELAEVTKSYLRESKRLVRKGYGGQRPGPAVDHLSLAVRPGEIVGLVGASGSGKTTAARMLVDLVRPSSGRVLVGGRDLSSLSRTERQAWRRDVQYMFQDNYGALNPRLTVAESVLEPLEVTGRTPEEIGWEGGLGDVLHDVGLDADFADRRPGQLSGGERQRVGIARALITRPRLILADEPVSALDVTVQKKILDLIVRLNRIHGTAFVVISHDLGVISYLASRVLVMNHGRVVDEGPTATVLGDPRHPYTRQLVEAVTHHESTLAPAAAGQDSKETVA